MYKEPEYKLDILFGEMKLEPEFNWMGRKTIRGLIFNKYEYFVCTPYLRITGTFDQMCMMLWRLNRHYV